MKCRDFRTAKGVTVIVRPASHPSSLPPMSSSPLCLMSRVTDARL